MGHAFVRSSWLLVFLTALPSFAQERSALPGPTIPDGFGVNIHFTDAEPGELELLKDGGNRFVRMDFAWQAVERRKGEYDFDRYDRLVADTSRLNVRILFILDYAHRFYDDGLPPRTAEGRLAFARFAAAAARRYAGKGILWEIWNEPNIKQFWKPQPNAMDYCKLAHATIDAIRAADPQAFIVGPASSTFPWDFFEVMGAQGVFKKLDAVSVHPYRQTNPETAEQDYARLRLLLHKYVPEKRLPILSGEWGYSTAWRGMTEEKQADYIVRQRLVNLACDVPLSIWYDWRDDGLDPKEPEHHVGTVYRDFKPKPSYVAAKALSESLAGYQFIRRVATGQDEDWILLFNNGRDSALAYWTTGKPREWKDGGISLDLKATPQIQQRPQDLTCWRVIGNDRIVRAGVEETLEVELGVVAAYAGSIAMRVNGETVYRSPIRWPTDAPAKYRIPFTVHRRDQRGGATAVVEVDGPTILSSIMPARVRLLVPNLLKVSVLPPVGKSAAVFVENPSGEALDAVARLNAPGVVASDGLQLERGQTQAMITFELPEEIGEGKPLWLKARDREGNTVFESKSGGWRRTTPPENDGQWRVALDGNDAVVAKARWFHHSFDAAPPQPGLTKQIELQYQFAEGWRFAMLQPPKGQRALSGRPKVFGAWVHGDGSRNMLRCRFVDSTGQTFQPDYGVIDWTGWRWVTMPLDGDGGGHWGGANDGVVHYPIGWDSIALVDNMNVTVRKPLSLRFAGFAVGYE